MRSLMMGVLLVGTAMAGVGSAADTQPAELPPLVDRPFVYGREFFVLRSGRAELIVQADKVDLGPAVTYLLFDAQNGRQSARMAWATNFDAATGFTASALNVELGGFRFTALGQRTVTRWVTVEGVPAVEAEWWAGGIRVTERIAALTDAGAFVRMIRLDGADLVAKEAVKVCLALLPGECQTVGAALLQRRKGANLGLAVAGETAVAANAEKRELVTGPVEVGPGAAVELRTLLTVEVPPGDAAAFAARTVNLAKSHAAAEWTATAKKWAGLSVVNTKDAVVQEMFDKARYGLPGMIADDGTMNAGIFEYGGQWVRDTSNTVLGAIHAGEFELARNTLRRVLTKMVNAEGATMIAGGFDEPDREQFDQMGELLHVLKAYRDWTGDDTLIRENRAVLRKMIERPLNKVFRDETGMVHNRREFWERTFEDAYELAYQTLVVQGLRDAADLAPALGAEDQAERWRSEAALTLKGMLAHPTRALVQDGKLIKRRNVNGEVAALTTSLPKVLPDAPSTTESAHSLLPDASEALCIALRVVDPKSELARQTLDDLERLRNTRWADGGYDRYHTSSQLDQPGPWTFATTFILRAQHEAGMFERSRRSLEWLNTVQGGRVGSWFEEIPSIRSTERACGVLPWTSGEVTLFVVRHWLGVRFEGEALVIAPALYPGSPPVEADLRFRQRRLRIRVDGAGPIGSATVDGKSAPLDAAGRLVLPKDFAGGTIELESRK